MVSEGQVIPVASVSETLNKSRSISDYTDVPQAVGVVSPRGDKVINPIHRDTLCVGALSGNRDTLRPPGPASSCSDPGYCFRYNNFLHLVRAGTGYAHVLLDHAPGRTVCNGCVYHG